MVLSSVLTSKPRSYLYIGAHKYMGIIRRCKSVKNSGFGSSIL